MLSFILYAIAYFSMAVAVGLFLKFKNYWDYAFVGLVWPICLPFIIPFLFVRLFTKVIDTIYLLIHDYKHRNDNVNPDP
jgi:hypothetical protein